MSTYKATAENLPRPSMKFGICARNGIMPIQSMKAPGLAKRNATVPVRSKVAGVGAPAGQQRTALKEIHNRPANVEAMVGALTKDVSNISIRPKAEVKPRKPLVDSRSIRHRDGGPKQPVVVLAKPKQRITKVADGTKADAAESKAVQPAAASVQGECSSYSAQLLQVQVENIDEVDEGNITLVTNYVDDIYKYLYELEAKYPIECNHLKDCKVTPRMRAILVSWMVEIHSELHLLAETLFLSIGILDRFLQFDHTVSKENLQLVGSTAMFVACKYEEMMPPDISHFVLMSGKAFSEDDVKIMEVNVLQALDFSLGRPLPLHFLRRFSKAAHATTEIHTQAKYALELCVMEYTMCHVPPSLLAAAALYTALYTACAGAHTLWTATLQHYTSYSETQVLPTARKVAAVVLAAKENIHKAVFVKYSSTKFGQVSLKADLARLKRLVSS